LSEQHANVRRRGGSEVLAQQVAQLLVLPRRFDEIALDRMRPMTVAWPVSRSGSTAIAERPASIAWIRARGELQRSRRWRVSHGPGLDRPPQATSACRLRMAKWFGKVEVAHGFVFAGSAEGRRHGCAARQRRGNAPATCEDSAMYLHWPTRWDRSSSRLKPLSRH
jgi:hypothetical protein